MLHSVVMNLRASRRGGERRAGTLRSFTLVEVLIAVAIVVALGSLVLPNLLGSLRDAAFDESVRLVVDSLKTARNEARRRGVPIRVVAETSNFGVVLFGELMRPAESPVSEAESLDEGERATGGARWPLAALRAGTLLTVGSLPATAPASVDGQGAAAGEPEEAAATVIELGVFLPDGSALRAGAATMTDRDYVAEITTTAWAGRVSAKIRHRPVTEGTPPGEEQRASGDAAGVPEQEVQP